MQSNRKQHFIIYTPEYARNLPGLNVYAIYPDNWGQNIKHKGVHNWGEPPCLGYVKEQSPYWAGVAAKVAGLVYPNATFEPKAVLIKTKNIPHQHYKRKYGNGKGNPSPNNKV